MIYSRSIVGKYHRKNKQLCQDRAKSSRYMDGYQLAVADGVGSHPHSEIGASFVVDRHTLYCMRNFDKIYSEEMSISDIMKTARQQLQKIAIDIGLESYRDLSTTWACVLVKGNKYIAIRCGDSSIHIRTTNDELIHLIDDKEENFVNATDVVGSTNSMETTQIVKGTMDTVKAFFLHTDGVSLKNSAFLCDFTVEDLDECIEYCRDHDHDDCSISYYAKEI